MKNDVTDFQDNYNRYMETQVSKTFGAEIGPDFKAFQHAGGFNYMTNDGIYYNLLTLQCLDALLKKDAQTEQFDIEEGGFSSLYCNVLKSASYTLSQDSQNKISAALTKYKGQLSEVINSYNRSGLPALTQTTPEAALNEIYENCKEIFGGEVDVDCTIIPNRYASFKLALQTLNNMAADELQLQMNVANMNGTLRSIIANITKPDDNNGGLIYGADKSKNPLFYVGYKVPSSNSLIGSLNTESNAITITVDGKSFDKSNMSVSIDNQSKFTIPVLSLIDIEVDHKSTFDMSKLKKDGTKFEASITYSGLTVVPVQPTPASPEGGKGWAADTVILKEIKEKTGLDVDGYKLTGSSYDVDKLFGGDLARLKAMLISKTPTITITLSAIDVEYAKQVFTTTNNVTVTLFGFIKLGQHDNTYETSNVHFDEQNNSVTLTFSEPNASGTQSDEELAAFIMGGVPYYPGMN